MQAQRFKESLDNLLKDDKMLEVEREVEIMSLEHKLEKFTGGTMQHRTIVPSILMSDGIKFLWECQGTKWLIDFLANKQLETKIARQEFQVWNLSKGKLTLNDHDNKEIYQELVTREFPLDDVTIWIIDKVIILPNEY